MEAHQLFFTPQTLLMDSIPHDDLMNCNAFDATITSYEHVFDEFMLFGNGYDGDGLRSTVESVFGGEGEGTSGFGLRIDAVEGSPDDYLPADGIASASPEEKQGDGSNSSGGATNAAKSRRDRSKTLISERRRRGRMKEKLYELRSLVPNITKMDKASIIADAVMYVQNLQRQAKKLVEEITLLESSSKVDIVSRIPFENTMNVSQVDQGRSGLSGGKVLRLIALEAGEGRFYVRLECSKGEGVSSALYSAVESLGCFDLESSNISIASEIYVLTLTLNVRGFVEEMNVSTVKLWVMGAILKEGFEFEMTAIF
ncbi:transcription factor FER-LIKE IRON DEFICIENCY-INDUCED TRANSCRIPTION FACTOR [Phoenix dactylifera]|uniref:Transcription factor FER-LIKE IRON DEFICIENCY-INDUCED TRANSCRIPTION FACTOR n=1 Tax=Phoenix dactylifera TaxID=42345 RepID=A0A8B7C075_PHODC|nr:transcription factor FER-LIKE IRON DEFICIENCY-INDUCED TRANSCRIPTION FACTOR [Phoenix dactylifera]